MKLRKSQMAALLLIALSLILGACMNTASSPEATQERFARRQRHARRARAGRGQR